MNTFIENLLRTSISFKTGLKTRLFNGVFTLVILFVSPMVTAQDFDELSEAIAQGNFGNLKAVVFSRHGEVVYEDYFRGAKAGKYFKQRVQYISGYDNND